MIEKGKGVRTKKPWTLEITEGGTQLTMRIFLWGRMSNEVEEVKRFPENDHGPQRGHSIKSALLEKRLMFDHAKKAGDVSACEMQDLQAWCNVQTRRSCSVAEEAIGVRRKDD